MVNFNLIIGLGAGGAFMLGAIIIGLLTFFGVFSTHHIATIILSVTLIATFIGVYFFTYGTYLEKVVVDNQMDYVVKDLVSDFKILAPEAAQSARISIQNIKEPDMRKEDEETAAANKKLLTTAMIVLASVFIAGIVSSLTIVFTTGVHAKEFFITNLIAIVIVGLTYFAFTNFAGRMFISADPNFVRKTILETLKNKTGGSLTDKQKMELAQRIAQQQLQQSKQMYMGKLNQQKQQQ